MHVLEGFLFLVSIARLVTGSQEIVRREAHLKINPSGVILTDVDESITVRPGGQHMHQGRGRSIGFGFEAPDDDGKPHLMQTIRKEPKAEVRKDGTLQNDIREADHRNLKTSQHERDHLDRYVASLQRLPHGALTASDDIELHAQVDKDYSSPASAHHHIKRQHHKRDSRAASNHGSLDPFDASGVNVPVESNSESISTHRHSKKQHKRDSYSQAPHGALGASDDIDLHAKVDSHSKPAVTHNHGKRHHDKRDKRGVAKSEEKETMHESLKTHLQHLSHQNLSENRVAAHQASFYRQCDTGLLRDSSKSSMPSDNKVVPFTCHNGRSPASADGAVSSPAGSTNRIRFFSDCNCNMNASVFFFEPESAGSGSTCMAGDRITAECNECDERLRYVCQGRMAQLRMFNRNDCTIDYSREVHMFPSCRFNFTAVEADKFLAGDCAKVPPECGVGSIQGVNNANLNFEDCTPDENLFSHPSTRPDSIDAFSDASCAGPMQFYFQPTQAWDGPTPTGPASNLCVPGDRVNVAHNPDACMPPLNSQSAAYHCDEDSATFVMYRNSGCIGTEDRSGEPDCEYQLSSSQAEEFRRGQCAVVLYPAHYTDEDIIRCGNVQSIIHRNISSDGGRNFIFRGADATADCSPGTQWQAAENMDDKVSPLEKVIVPTETTKEEDEKRMVLLILMPIIICTFLGGTVFALYYYRSRLKSQATSDQSLVEYSQEESAEQPAQT
jgi:hypothetical protein